MESPGIPDELRGVYESAVLARIADELVAHRHVGATGQWGSCALLLAAGVQRRLNRPVLVVHAHLDEADDALEQLAYFRPDARSELFPAHEVLPGESNLSQELAAQRLELAADLGGSRCPQFLLAPIQALMQPCPNESLLAEQIVTLRAGAATENTRRDALIAWLAGHGYTRLDAVENPGDFAVRGEIIDVWPVAAAQPVRLQFFGEGIERLHGFDPETLSPSADISSVRLAGLEQSVAWPVERTVSFLSLLPRDTIIWFIEPAEIQEQGRSYFDRLSDARGIYPPAAVFRQAEDFAWAQIHQFAPAAESTLRLPCRSVEQFDTQPEAALAELAALAAENQVVVVCQNSSERNRLQDLLHVKHPGIQEKVAMPIGDLAQGFRWRLDEAAPSAATGDHDHACGPGSEGARTLGPHGAVSAGETPAPSAKAATPVRPAKDSPPAVASRPPAARAREDGRWLILLAHHELFHRYHQKRRLRGLPGARPLDHFLDLAAGDYVVHVQHGIARYQGISNLSRDGRSLEYLTLVFARDATLHVPITQIHLVQKYVGGAQGRPPLSVLGGSSWAKQKEKVSEALEQLATDMLQTQAARRQFPGVAYPTDTLWMKEFENAFPFQPTPDQISCMESIKADLQQPRPMDRLLCGDVGYGKTELAIRAAFKVCEAGKQVAVLAPTTVLVEQHENTFRQRMGDYPFVVESISRFKTAQRIRDILQRTAQGRVDVLIGTHRLLSRDVQFADLGLVVIDEEQRFGVAHKERLKQLRLTVDVLTMTATPIPRTLHMSLLGLRDISNLATPPRDRRSVVTEVMAWDAARIQRALQRELARDGQIYFVHNRVWNIAVLAAQIQRLAPDARVVIGHGQMPDPELEDVMHRFVTRQADILVSTTIIESGLDIPSANTIFIHEAENFGLSDLHQLRGRVGRSHHRAYCYLVLSADKAISDTAAKRLKAMEEYASLGAGFKIALRDLEIRGAGNLLGQEQSGHIAAVGYELYCQLLEQAVKRVQNLPLEQPPEVNLDLGVTGSLPRTYVSSEKQRMELYRRLSRCHSLETLAAWRQDIRDAFGPLPKAAETLFALAELRVLAVGWGVVSIISHRPDLIFTLQDLSKLGPLLQKAPGVVRPVDEKSIYLRLPPAYFEGDTLMNVLRNMLAAPAGRKQDLPSAKGNPGASGSSVVGRHEDIKDMWA